MSFILDRLYQINLQMQHVKELKYYNFIFVTFTFELGFTFDILIDPIQDLFIITNFEFLRV